MSCPLRAAFRADRHFGGYTWHCTSTMYVQPQETHMRWKRLGLRLEAAFACRQYVHALSTRLGCRGCDAGNTRIDYAHVAACVLRINMARIAVSPSGYAREQISMCSTPREWKQTAPVLSGPDARPTTTSIAPCRLVPLYRPQCSPRSSCSHCCDSFPPRAPRTRTHA